MKLDTKAAQLKLPPSKVDVIFFDDDLAGFGIRLRAAGGALRRTWIAQYRAHGRTRRMRIGSAEKVSAEEARKAARKILAKVELGGDPQGEKVSTRLKAARTLRSVADDYLNAKVGTLRPASYRATASYLTGQYFRPLHATTITDVTLADVAGAHRRDHAQQRQRHGRPGAQRPLQLLSMGHGRGLAWAASDQSRDPDQPTSGFSTARPVLNDAELAAIWRACKDDDFGRIVRLLMLTACRREEIGALRWSEIDLNKGLLTLPKERTKKQARPRAAAAAAGAGYHRSHA